MCNETGRSLPSETVATYRIPIQASHGFFRYENLPPQCYKRREGQHVSGNAACRRVET